MRDVYKSSFARIPKQSVLTHAGHHDVRKTIVVVIAHGNAHAIHFQVEAGALRHIGKGAITIVAANPERSSRALVARPVHSVDQQDGLPTVAVIIQKSAA